MNIGEKVRQTRQRRGMNQKQLAESSGISQANISRIENGLVEDLRSETLKRLVMALGVPVDYLIDTAPDDPHPTAHYLLKVYETLSPRARRQLEDFAVFLRFFEERGGKLE